MQPKRAKAQFSGNLDGAVLLSGVPLSEGQGKAASGALFATGSHSTEFVTGEIQGNIDFFDLELSIWFYPVSFC